MKSPSALGAKLERRLSMTDELQQAIDAMLQGVPGARKRAMQLTQALHRHHRAVAMAQYALSPQYIGAKIPVASSSPATFGQ